MQEFKKKRKGNDTSNHLGTDSITVNNQLIKLKIKQIQSNNRLIKDIDTIQTKLNRIGHHNRPYDDVMKDIRMHHSKQILVENMVGNNTKTAFPFYSYMLVFFTVMIFTAGLFFIITEPSITGAAIKEITDVIGAKFIATAIGSLIMILIMGMVLHHVDYKHKTRYDKYKNPKMLEK